MNASGYSLLSLLTFHSWCCQGRQLWSTEAQTSYLSLFVSQPHFHISLQCRVGIGSWKTNVAMAHWLFTWMYSRYYLVGFACGYMLALMHVNFWITSDDFSSADLGKSFQWIKQCPHLFQTKTQVCPNLIQALDAHWISQQEQDEFCAGSLHVRKPKPRPSESRKRGARNATFFYSSAPSKVNNFY